ncbi:DUF6516 family protein [Caldilinea sp.]|uniref:toxin-antitoxin system TumE family protein n=1 Tax=Caldilinea sp. TaxID=2293560 RepID=UPI002C61E8D7|nr:hypothetical protein [Anaerolineales bacterium]HQY91597.1 DUF6516 family protein [Caldilinea sp.]HRA65374.1 DUF6516 family protein [Caldilinea sp.]
MQAADRLLEIERLCSGLTFAVVPLDLDGETLRVILYLNNGSTLRITEQWQGSAIRKYSYYLLNSDNTLHTGWDNAPHHHRLKLAQFPHHKHVGSQGNIQDSSEASLEAVLQVIREQIFPK